MRIYVAKDGDIRECPGECIDEGRIVENRTGSGISRLPKVHRIGEAVDSPVEVKLDILSVATCNSARISEL
jgi:hypothetical protein